MSENIDRALLMRRIDAEIMKMLDESAKIRAETSRINAELKAHPWLPILSMVLGTGGISAIVAAAVTAFVIFLHHGS